jgi:DNA-binding SARP family transcriptional activator
MTISGGSGDRPLVARAPARLSGEQPAAPLQIQLLGSPDVTWAGSSLSISRRKVRALLYRLAAGHQPASREHLCYLFWPDIRDADARRNLTGLLSHLRRALPLPEVLVAADDRVWLDPDLAWSDTGALEQLRTAQQPPGAARQQTVDLYRGPFLDGFSLPDSPEYETWMMLERQTWERRYLEALAILIDEATTHGDYGEAITYARRYLAADDLAEEMHRRLIALLTASGDRTAALRQFEQCVQILERELGVEPLPETQEAYQAALDSHPLPATAPLLPQGSLSERAPLSEQGAELATELAAGLAWTTLPGPDVDLVGRDEALQQLEQAYARARSGQGSVVLMSGESGIGKSRLMQHFATSMEHDVLVLAGAGYRDAHTKPYQPVVEALRPAVMAQHTSLAVPSCCLAETSRLMPELRLLYPDLPPPMTGGEQARAELFEALCRITLRLASNGRPLLVCLDDLHWADETTLEWLAFLGRRLQESRTLVIGTYRSDEASAVAELRRGLARQGVLSELQLTGLDEAAVVQLLRRLEDSLPGDTGLAGRLQHLTGGNPFYLLETVRAILETGCELEDLGDPAGPCLPDTVRETVEARVARLSPRARQVLEAGAVLGQSFALGLVQRTSGRQEMETMDGLDELVARHLLEEGATGYWFRHEIIRSAVYSQISQWRKRVLHRRAGEALERLEPNNAAALARHFELAEEPGRAARYVLRAGRAAREVFAHSEARAYFDQALSLLVWEAVDLEDAEAVAANQRLRLEALHERGWVLRLLGDMEAYARDLEEVASLASSLGDPRTLAHLHWRQAYTHRWFCRFDEARVTAEEGVDLSLAAAEPLLEAMCRREVGLAARALGDTGQARAMLEQALDLFVEMGDTAYEIHTLGNLATLFWYQGAHQASLDLSRQALARCDEAGLVLERRLPLGDMGVAAAALGDVDLAREYLEDSLAIARQTADRTQEILCLTHLGWLDVRLGKPEEASAHLQAGLALAERIGSCTEQSWLLSGLAEASRLAGNQAEAAAHAGRALALAQASGAVYDQELAHRTLAKLGAG